MATHEHLCKNALLIRTLYVERIICCPDLSVEDKCEKIFDLYVMALEGEKDCTPIQLKDHFKADGYGRDKDGLFVLLSSELYYEAAQLSTSNYGRWCEITKQRKDFTKYLDAVNDKMEQFTAMVHGKKPADTYVVEAVFTFDNVSDIMITDPCYIRKFIHPTNVKSTIYGDWSCGVFECEPGKMPDPSAKPFGEFCADGGQVCVTDIRNAPNRVDIVGWMNNGHKHCATVIKGFTGKVEYRVLTSYFAFEGEWCEDVSCYLYGIGQKDGKDFAFVTTQTGC